MSESPRPLTRFFEGILASQSFELVRDFLDETKWATLLPEEKELLSQLFLLSADQKIAQIHIPDTTYIFSTSFSEDKIFPIHEIVDPLLAACKLTPDSAKVWFRLGSYYALYESENALQEAMRAFQTSISLDNRFFDAHYNFATCALRFGIIFSSIDYLVLADTSFERAVSLVDVEHEARCPAELYWYWGINLFLLARDSGEPVDYQKSCAAYKKAKICGIDKPDFYNDYANCIVELALLINNTDLIQNVAIPLYEESIISLPSIDNATEQHIHDAAVRNFNIACCYQHLFEESHNKVLYQKADTAFANAANTMPKEKIQCWQKWGQLNLYAGRLYQDIVLIEKCVQCFECAEEQHSKKQIREEESVVSSSGSVSSIAYALWSQALLIIAETKNQPYMLSEAYKKAELAFNIELVNKKETTHPEVYTSLALCLYGLGRYFNDKNFFEKAKEIIQKGLTDNAKSASLWYSLALIKLSLGDATGSEIFIKESLISFMLASKSLYARFPIFWSDWGIALLHLADWTQDSIFAQEAVHRLERAIELSELLHDESIFNLAAAYDLLGELTDDEQYTEKAVVLFEDLYHTGKHETTTVIYQYALSLFHLGEITDQVEFLYKAKAIFEEYLDRDPEDEIALTEYALVLTTLGVYIRDEMLTQLDTTNTIHSKETQESRSSDVIAEEKQHHHMRLPIPQEWFDAEECFLRAAIAGFGPSHYHLACLYSLMNNYHDALEKLYESFELDALPSPDDMLEDEWLHPHFLKTPQFNEFFSIYLAAYQENEMVAVDEALQENEATTLSFLNGLAGIDIIGEDAKEDSKKLANDSAMNDDENSSSSYASFDMELDEEKSTDEDDNDDEDKDEQQEHGGSEI